MKTLEAYVKELVKDKEIARPLTNLVEGFAKVWLSGADKMDRQRAWNYSGVIMKSLDQAIRMKIRSDRNRNGFAVDLGV